MKYHIENLLLIMKKRGVSRAQAAEYLDLNVNNFSNWRAGKAKISASHLYQLSELLNVSLDLICGKRITDSDNLEELSISNKKKNGKNILVKSVAEAGHISSSLEESTKFGNKNVDIPGVDYEAITMGVQGDSMAPVLIHGDYVVGRKLEDVTQIRHNQIHIVNSRVGVYIKYVTKYEGGLWLIPEAKEFQAELIPYDEIISVWEVRVRITESLDSPLHHPNYMQLLADMNELKELVKKKK